MTPTVEPDSNRPRPTWRSPGLGWLLGYSFLLVMGMGLTAVARPQLTIDLVCYAERGPPIDSQQCRHDADVQKHTARIRMLARLIGGLLTIATTAYWSALSDRWGRTRLLAFCQVGWIFNEALFLALATWPKLTGSGLWVLVVGPAFDGALGGFSAIDAIISAYMSEVVSKEALMRSTTLINGVFAVGASLSPSFASLLAQWTGDSVTPIRVAIGVHVLLLIYCLFILPESNCKPSDPRKPDSNTETLGETFFRPFRLLSTNRNLILLAAVLLIVTQGQGLGEPSAQYLMYAMGWDQKEIGPFLTLASAARVLVLLVIIPGLTAFLQPRWQRLWVVDRAAARSESTPLLAEEARSPTEEDLKRKATASFNRALLFASLAAKCAGLFIQGANARASGAVFIAGNLVTSLSAAANPGTGVLAVEFVDADKRGQLFGAFGVVQAISTTIIGPVIYTYIFVATIEWYPAFIYLVASATAALGVVLTTMVRFK